MTVTAEVQKGYLLQGKVFRSALVIVAKSKETKTNILAVRRQMRMSKIIGIDLGTTNSCVAFEVGSLRLFLRLKVPVLPHRCCF